MKYAILTGVVDGIPKVLAGPTTDIDGLKKTVKSIIAAGCKHGEAKKEVTCESVSIDLIGGRHALKTRKC
jgi:hypothetical protein